MFLIPVAFVCFDRYKIDYTGDRAGIDYAETHFQFRAPAGHIFYSTHCRGEIRSCEPSEVMVEPLSRSPGDGPVEEEDLPRRPSRRWIAPAHRWLVVRAFHTKEVLREFDL